MKESTKRDLARLDAAVSFISNEIENIAEVAHIIAQDHWPGKVIRLTAGDVYNAIVSHTKMITYTVHMGHETRYCYISLEVVMDRMKR